ncbi:hypothetical protein NESM_000358000 [Novymonas esmeraldas]|uniref:Uncharacterized protein n=1 Tax=Novymonas esmeraldas TaxID=1808958 RepID=A0AAW0ELA7_9TRYP
MCAYRSRPVLRHALTAAAVSLCVVLCVAVAVPVHATAAKRRATELLAHVTFVSCNRQSRDQSFWTTRITPTIAAQCERGGGGNGSTSRPHTDLLLWLGNAVYADVDEAGVALSLARPVADVEREYKLLTESPHYSGFVRDVVGASGRVVGVWDDRDLGLRGADHRYTQSEAVRRLYLTQMWKGHTMAVTDSAGDGTPGALYSFTATPAPAGTPLAAHFVHSVCTLTLDVHTQRTAPPNLADALLRGNEEAGLRLFGSKGPALEAQLAQVRAARARVMEADLLGPRQWAWLEKVLATYLASTARSPGDAAGRAHCAVTLIATPWQLLLNDNKPFEGWDLYPASRSRLLLLLRKHRVARFLFLSGHAEVGELGVVRRAAPAELRATGPTASLTSRFPLEPLTRPAATLLPPLPSHLIEVTSSGLTHTAREATLVGWLMGWLTTPRVAEDAKDTGLLKRHLFLTRTTTMERQFGTVQLLGDGSAAAAAAEVATQDAVLARTKVIVTLHSVQRAGAPLLTVERTLANLPSYAVQSQEDEDAEAEAQQQPHDTRAGREAVVEEAEEAIRAMDAGDLARLPIFNVYNVPGDYPWLKRRLAERQCAEVPCTRGQHFMLLRVIANLALAFAGILLLVAGVYCYQLRHADEDEGGEVKLKQE